MKDRRMTSDDILNAIKRLESKALHNMEEIEKLREFKKQKRSDKVLLDSMIYELRVENRIISETLKDIKRWEEL